MRKPKFLLWSGLIIFLSGLVLWFYFPRSPATRFTQLIVGLDFTISGYHAPWFVALEKGYFAEEGLGVVIHRGYSSGDTVRKLTAGVVDLGFAHPAHAILAVSEGAQLKIVMGYFVNEMCTVYSYREKGNVRSPKDLEGKRWGSPAGDVCVLLLEPLSAVAGFERDTIQFVNMDAASRIPALVQGRIDATGSFYDKDQLFREAGKQARLTLVSLRYANYLDFYSNSVLASERLLRDRPQALRGFVRALGRGLEFTLENPSEAVEILLRHHPELDPAYVQYSVAILAEATRDPGGNGEGRGVLDPEKMERTIGAIARYLKIEHPPPASAVYTNEFVEWANHHPR